MGKSVKIIGKNKWIFLSPRQKHTALAKFALYCIDESNPDEFLEYYNRLISYAPIDRYKPPAWINDKEALELFFSFHQKLSGKAISYFIKSKTEKAELIWNYQKNISVILDQVLTPYNIGSILRIIDNFGFSELIHSTKGLDIDNSHLKRSAMGTEQWIPIQYIDNLPKFLQKTATPVIALEKTSKSIPITKWAPPTTPFNIIIGNEAYGISDNILSYCSESVHIPMLGYKNSMNLSHAFGILSFYISNHHIKTK